MTPDNLSPHPGQETEYIEAVMHQLNYGDHIVDARTIRQRRKQLVVVLSDDVRLTLAYKFMTDHDCRPTKYELYDCVARVFEIYFERMEVTPKDWQLQDSVTEKEMIALQAIIDELVADMVEHELVTC